MPPLVRICCHMLPQRRLTTLLALTSDAAARPLGRTTHGQIFQAFCSAVAASWKLRPFADTNGRAARLIFRDWSKKRGDERFFFVQAKKSATRNGLISLDASECLCSKKILISRQDLIVLSKIIFSIILYVIMLKYKFLILNSKKNKIYISASIISLNYF